MSSGEIQNELARLGIRPIASQVRIVRFDDAKADERCFYLKTPEHMRSSPLVLHPSHGELFSALGLPGLRIGQRYKNSNMRRFPPSESGSHYGIDVSVEHPAAVRAVLVKIGLVNDEPHAGGRDGLDEIKAEEATLSGLERTEREQIVKARLGQGVFRDAVLRVWQGRCAVTDLRQALLLRASHIKPWRVSDNVERLDPENGLLLGAGLDAAFDAGLISFSDDGRLLLSERLAPSDLARIGALPEARLREEPTARRREYLRYHRRHVFSDDPLGGCKA